MKVSELKHHIEEQLKAMPRFADWEVVIPISEPSIGATSAIKAKGAGFGFDWNAGKFFIYPEIPVIRKKQ